MSNNYSIGKILFNIVPYIREVWFVFNFRSGNTMNTNAMFIKSFLRVNIDIKLGVKGLVVFEIPSNVKDGQKFVAKNILFKNKKGKNVKKNVHFKVRVK